MARVQENYEPGAEALRTTAAPNIQTVQARFDPNANPAYRLAAALGKAQPVIQNIKEDQERKALQEQLLKIDSYKEQFSKDTQGPVTEAQIGQRFPETVPIVRARIAEAVGSDFARKSTQGIIDRVLQDDALRLDSDKRAAYLKAEREKIVGGLQGDDFYKAGAIRAIDSELKQWENSWQSQTAAYHQDVQKQDFSNKVVEAMKGPEPGQALENLDSQWKQSSSLNNVERNKLVIDTVTKQAFADLNPDLLNNIPERFLNAQSKAEIQQTKAQIQSAKMTTLRDNEYKRKLEIEENVRSGKMDIIKKAMTGEVNPGDYRLEPELFNYALQMKDLPKLPEATSTANAQKIRSAVIDGSTTAGMDSNKIIDGILTNPNLNPKEKQSLINEVPKLLEGRIAMDDPMVKNAMSLRLDPALKALETSTNAKIQTMVTGQNLRGQAISMFEKGLQAQMFAYYQDHGAFPTGRAKLDLIEQEVIKAEKYISERTKIGGSNAPQAAPPAPAAQAQRPVPTQADIDWVKKNPRDRQKFIDTFGREP